MYSEPPVRIVLARPRDATLLLDMVRELAHFEHQSEAVCSTAEDLRRALASDPPQINAFIAYYKGEPAGFATWYWTFSTFKCRPGLYLEDLYVREAYRRLGAGRAIMARLARMAVDRGCDRMSWLVLDWNVNAQNFYAQLGGTPNSPWFGYQMSETRLRALAAKDAGD